MTQDDKALQDLFDTVHYSVELIDDDMEEEDELDPDDDEDYEPELSPEQQLGMMTDEEWEALMDAHAKSRDTK